MSTSESNAPLSVILQRRAHAQNVLFRWFEKAPPAITHLTNEPCQTLKFSWIFRNVLEVKNCDLTLFSSRRRRKTQFLTQLLLRSQSHPELVFGFRLLRIWLLFSTNSIHLSNVRNPPPFVRGNPGRLFCGTECKNTWYYGGLRQHLALFGAADSSFLNEG